MRHSIESLTKLDEYITRNYPDADYEGGFPEDSDELDYANINLKGTVIA